MNNNLIITHKDGRREMTRQEFKDFAQKIVADVRFRSNEDAMYKVMEHLRSYAPVGMIAVEKAREMTREILAKVDDPWYRVDIDNIASKYIGEEN